MSEKLKLTRPELKRQREALARFQRYLPMLRLKQQLLQVAIRQTESAYREAEMRYQEAVGRFQPLERLGRDRAGVDLEGAAKPDRVVTGQQNVAGLAIPTFSEVSFEPIEYSLLTTPPWVDRYVEQKRELVASQIEQQILRRQLELLRGELLKIIQRVNLFEKVKIPQTREAIRVIRIYLGDQMTAAVGRAKIAKGKLSQGTDYGLDDMAMSGRPDGGQEA
jgi:V/A-type H+/Na+-transporting ATPase subunit D